ncbi:hypothetical protein HHI36_006476 [Cryptolaemus montrouzieri]|uniref:PDZ domain-containing protein n=1 Tax=Cryptolaemus montrouzieri TaxID=559131 RepID=A0ABD2NXQ9_9CUCU
MEIFLTRPHREVPWGFRLIGGSDSHLPIIVSKVLENSIAEKSGLEEDVLVERINNVPTTGLSHDEVNRIILATENELFFTVRRENLENLILASLNDEDNNSEITRILREAAKKDKIIEEDENSINAEDEILGFKREFGETMIIEPRINQDIKIINPNKYEQSPLYSTSLKGKKWSTFLQKPKNPPPRLKHDATIPKANQYKVIIKKQVKKEKSEPTKQESKEISEENRGKIIQIS